MGSNGIEASFTIGELDIEFGILTPANIIVNKVHMNNTSREAIVDILSLLIIKNW